MAQVISVTIVSKRQSGSTLRIGLEVVTEDNNAIQHTERKVLRGQPLDFDVYAWLTANEDKIINTHIKREVETLKDIKSGLSPLTALLTPTWGTTKIIGKELLMWMMAEKDVRVLLYLKAFVQYVQQNYTAVQAANLLDTTTAEILRLNNRVNAIFSDTGDTAENQLAVFDFNEGALEEVT